MDLMLLSVDIQDRIDVSLEPFFGRVHAFQPFVIRRLGAEISQFMARLEREFVPPRDVLSSGYKSARNEL